MLRRTKNAGKIVIAVTALLGTMSTAGMAKTDRASVFDRAIERPKIELSETTDEMFTRKFEFARKYSSEFHRHADEAIRKAIENAKIMIETDIDSALRFANQTNDTHAVDLLVEYKTACNNELNNLASELRTRKSLDEIVENAKSEERDVEIDKEAVRTNITGQIESIVNQKTNEQLSRLLAI